MSYNNIHSEPWVEIVKEGYSRFLDWFTGLEIAGQVITGILIILALIAVGYIVYGSLWLAYQVTKASLILTVVIVYYTFAGLILLFEIPFAIAGLMEKETMGKQWDDISYNMKWFIAHVYPTKDGEMPKKPIKKQVIVEKSAPQRAPVIIIKEHDQQIEVSDKQVKIEESIEKPEPKYFCPNCGVEFTKTMVETLKSKSFTFCEACGEKFSKRDIERQ